MWSKIQKYFQSQIAEINSSIVLRTYAFFILGTQALSLYFMRSEATTGLTETSFPVSWPGVPAWLEIRSQSFWLSYLIVWAVVLCVAAWGFWRKTKLGYVALLAAFLMKGLLSFQSYNFMGNYHYMPAIITLIFLFIPRKKELLPLFIIFFYIAAGFLKLNPEWFTGQAVLKPLPTFLRFFGNWNFSFVVFLELVIVWFLIFPQRFLRLFGFLSLVTFHLISWYWVGYFYPLIMLQLLMIFPLLWWYEPVVKEAVLFQKFGRVQYAVIALFWLAQVLPMVQKGDSALTGNGRLWSLNMYDARSDCYEESFIRKGKEIIETTGEALTAVRVHCDPIIYIDQLTKVCTEMKSLTEPSTVSLFLSSKRRSDINYTEVLRFEDYCANPVKYNLWGWNKWLNL